MELENVRHLCSNENDAIYGALMFAQKNPEIVGLDVRELEVVKELIKLFTLGMFRISENMSLIE